MPEKQDAVGTPVPVHWRAVTLSPHPLLHPIFEIIGYTAGYALYRRGLGRSGDVRADDQRWLIFASASIGALLGSRMLGLLAQAPGLHLTWRNLLLPGGRSIIGGLLGGWMAVELVRCTQGIDFRVADLMAAPLCLGIAIGRVGCFVAGLADGTYGTPTSRPWGVNFGDGISRHPTQLYEILFLIALGSILHRYQQRPHPEEAAFRLFMAAYLSWRLGIDFIKPQPVVYGLNLIQWACVAGLLALLPGLVRICSCQLSPIRSTE